MRAWSGKLGGVASVSVKCWSVGCKHCSIWTTERGSTQHTYNCHHHVTGCRVPFDLCSTGQQVNTDVKLPVPEGGSNLSSTRQYSWSNPTPRPWSVDLWSHVTGQGEAESQLLSLGHFELCDEMVLWWDDFVTRWLYYDMMMTVWQHNCVTRRSVSEELDTGHVVAAHVQLAAVMCSEVRPLVSSVDTQVGWCQWCFEILLFCTIVYSPPEIGMLVSNVNHRWAAFQWKSLQSSVPISPSLNIEKFRWHLYLRTPPCLGCDKGEQLGSDDGTTATKTRGQ